MSRDFYTKIFLKFLYILLKNFFSILHKNFFKIYARYTKSERRRSLAPKSPYYTTFLKFCQGFFCTKIKKFFPKIYTSCTNQFWLFAQKFLYFFVFFVKKAKNIFSFLHKDLIYFLKKLYKMHKFLLFYAIYTKKLRFLLILFT